MKTIGIISDTHGSLHEGVVNALAECDAVVHAGDIGNRSILYTLNALAPTHAVLGNNDFPSDYNLNYYESFTIEGIDFFLAHKPTDVAAPKLKKLGIEVPQIRIHGHTHVPKIEEDGSTLLICPGSVSLPRSGYPRTLAKLTVDNGNILDFHIEDLQGNKIQI